MGLLLQELAVTLVTLALWIQVEVATRLSPGNLDLSRAGFWSSVFTPLLVPAGAVIISVVITLLLILRGQVNEAAEMRQEGAESGVQERRPSFLDGQTEVNDRYSSHHSGSFDTLVPPSAPRLLQVEERVRSPSLALALDRIKDSFNSVSTHFECPVCLEQMRPPIKMLQCSMGHVVCLVCVSQGHLEVCPSCRQPLVGRNCAMEKLAGEYFVSFQQ